jgi:hypothetical protein
LSLIVLQVLQELSSSRGVLRGKVEGTPKYVPTSPSVDWNAVADEMAADPDDHDSLDEDTLEDLTMSWRHGIGWSEERAARRGLDGSRS